MPRDAKPFTETEPKRSQEEPDEKSIPVAQPPRKSRDAEPSPEAESKRSQEEPEEKAIPAQPKRPPAPDILFISAIWTTEIVEVLLARFTEDYLNTQKPGSRGIGVKELRIMSAVLVTTAIIMTMTTGIILQFVLLNSYSFKFWMMFGLLSVYFLSSPTGLVLTATECMGVAMAMSCLRICWNVVSPIRFWYIFHQFFPISVQWSHLIVSGNVLAIGIVEYIGTVTVNVTIRDDIFPASFYYHAFTYTTVATLGWLIGLFFLKDHQNPVHGNLSAVRRVYVDTELIERFDRKQTKHSIYLFMAVIAPAVMIPVMKEFVKAGINRLPVNAVSLDLNLVRFRPDMLVSLIVVVAVEGVLHFLRKIRNELTDLVLIGASHLINIVVIVLFLAILNNSEKARKVMGETTAANLVLFNNVMDTLIIDVGSEIKDVPVLNYVQLLINDVSEDGTVPLVIKNSTTSQSVHEENISLGVQLCSQAKKKYFVNMYIFRQLGGGFELLRSSLSYVDVNDYTPKFFCAQETCTNYNPELAKIVGLHPEITTGVLSQSGRCLPVSWQMHLVDPNGPEEPNATVSPPFKPPSYVDYTGVSFKVPCGPEYSLYPHSCRPVHLVFYELREYFTLVYPSEAAALNLHTVNFCSAGRDLFTVYGLKFFVHLTKPYEFPQLFFSEFRLPEPLPEIKLLVSVSVYGLSSGIAWVGYIHFIWVQCPTRMRMVIISAFFSLLYAASWLSERILTEFDEKSVLVTLAFAALFTFWHFGTTVLFAARWYSWQQKDKRQQPWLRF